MRSNSQPRPRNAWGGTRAASKPRSRWVAQAAGPPIALTMSSTCAERTVRSRSCARADNVGQGVGELKGGVDEVDAKATSCSRTGVSSCVSRCVMKLRAASGSY